MNLNSEDLINAIKAWELTDVLNVISQNPGALRKTAAGQLSPLEYTIRCHADAPLRYAKIIAEILTIISAQAETERQIDFAHYCTEVTLPWIYARLGRFDKIRQQFVAYTGFITDEKKPQDEKNPPLPAINFNASPQGEDHPDKGITVFWLMLNSLRHRLAQNKQSIDTDTQAFLNLVINIAHRSSIINFNASPQNESHPDKGITVFSLILDSLRHRLTQNEQSIDADTQTLLNLVYEMISAFKMLDISQSNPSMRVIFTQLASINLTEYHSNETILWSIMDLLRVAFGKIEYRAIAENILNRVILSRKQTVKAMDFNAAPRAEKNNTVLHLMTRIFSDALSLTRPDTTADLSPVFIELSDLIISVCEETFDSIKFNARYDNKSLLWWLMNVLSRMLELNYPGLLPLRWFELIKNICITQLDSINFAINGSEISDLSLFRILLNALNFAAISNHALRSEIHKLLLHICVNHSFSLPLNTILDGQHNTPLTLFIDAKKWDVVIACCLANNQSEADIILGRATEIIRQNDSSLNIFALKNEWVKLLLQIFNTLTSDSLVARISIFHRFVKIMFKLVPTDDSHRSDIEKQILTFVIYELLPMISHKLIPITVKTIDEDKEEPEEERNLLEHCYAQAYEHISKADNEEITLPDSLLANGIFYLANYYFNHVDQHFVLPLTVNATSADEKQGLDADTERDTDNRGRYCRFILDLLALPVVETCESERSAICNLRKQVARSWVADKGLFVLIPDEHFCSTESTLVIMLEAALSKSIRAKATSAQAPENSEARNSVTPAAMDRQEAPSSPTLFGGPR